MVALWMRSRLEVIEAKEESGKIEKKVGEAEKEVGALGPNC